MQTPYTMDSNNIQVGDCFNETDEDEKIQVTQIRSTNDPPTVLCSVVRDTYNSDSEETETEYDMAYVTKAVNMMRKFVEEGFDQYSVRDVYKLSVKKLRYALELAKQNTTGFKKTLRDRLMFYLNIKEIPSDVESDEDYKPTVNTKKKDKGGRKPKIKKSASAAASATAVPEPSGEESDDEESTDDDLPDLVDMSKHKKKGTRKGGKGKDKKSASAAASATAVSESSSDSSDSSYDESSDEESSDEEEEEEEIPSQNSKKSGASSSKNFKSTRHAGPHTGRKRKSSGTNKHKTKRGKRVKGKKKKTGKHFAIWRRVESPVSIAPRRLPCHTWRGRCPPRNTCSTPFKTFISQCFTKELSEFARREFNYYPRFLGAQRTRPHYINKNRAWPPKWVHAKGRDGPMYLSYKEYM